GIDVFQVKYCPQTIGAAQQAQILDSFQTALTNSAFKMKTWTLCIPIDMGLAEKKWFDGWKSNQSRTGVQIKPVWGASKIHELLLSEKNRSVRDQFFKLETPQRLREIDASLQRLPEQIVSRLSEAAPIPQPAVTQENQPLPSAR